MSLPTDTESIDRFPIGRTGVPLPWPETVVPILADGLSYDVKRPSWITCLKVLVDGLTVQCGQSNKYLSIYLMLMISEPEDQRFAALCCFQKLIMCFSCPRCLSKWSADWFYFPCTRFTQVCLLKSQVRHQISPTFSNPPWTARTCGDIAQSTSAAWRTGGQCFRWCV